MRELQAGSPEEAPPRPIKAGLVEVWSRITLADGMEIQVEPGRTGMTPEQVRTYIQDVTADAPDAIAWVAPVARALMRGQVGDTVEVRTPAGIDRLEVLAIAYPDDAASQ